MWSDNETNRDFVNFRCVADTAAEMIAQAEGEPLSIGICGGWGVGKSTMLQLISDSLKTADDGDYLFVHFNAWLYQGYDDARAALLEVIARQLVQHASDSAKGVEKAKRILDRVDWVRVAGLTVGSAVSLAAGLPPVGLLGFGWGAAKELMTGSPTAEEVESIQDAGQAIAAEAKTLVRPTQEPSPPRQIQDLRSDFEDALCEMEVTLVVFIDDLDRCLPSTAMATLEAIRLFLFLPHTAFIIAADDRMIRQSVRAHFRHLTLDEDLVTNYFDKLVQVPVRVPPLGTQEVRAYLMLLFVENSGLDSVTCEDIRERVCTRLAEAWKGHRVDSHFVLGLLNDCPDGLRKNVELADRLAPLMTTAKQIAGNPRLIKRFLNTLSIRLAIAKAQGIAIDEEALAKMLLFERCADVRAHVELISAINDGDEGKPRFLAHWEARAQAGQPLADLPSEWDSPFVRDWLALQPSFADMDLRPVVYVSREHLPIVTPTDQLSRNAAEILEALLGVERISGPLKERLEGISGHEITLIMHRLMVKARQIQEWGTPSVLWGILTLVEAEPSQATSFAQFLTGLSPKLVRPDVIPVLGDRAWARPILGRWVGESECSQAVRRAIDSLMVEDT